MVSLEQQQQMSASTNNMSNHNTNSDEKLEALGNELQQLKEQNLQLKSTLKSVLNNTIT
jgi:predicted  nucleic acid-binding Zn-ribbon protein